MAAILEVEGLVNQFGSQTVHDGLDMAVEEGEVFGIVGGSGTGKSVLTNKKSPRSPRKRDSCGDQRAVIW